jgi:rubrerythrin
MSHTQSTQTGMNRTGIQMSPLDSASMQDVDPALMGQPGDESALVEMRNTYIANADSLGSVPLPATLTGVVKTGLSLLTGDNPQILLDKLGERLAFERTGTRLYDALITKCDVMLDGDISMTIDDLERIRSEEARHFMLIADAIETLGGDPTSQTPSADLAGVESLGLVQVLNDPRTTIAQSLHAIVTAELSDRAGWETLIGLADEHDLTDMVASFSEALDREREHLAMVTTWYEEALGLTYGDVELGADAAGAEAEPASAAQSTSAAADPMSGGAAAGMPPAAGTLASGTSASGTSADTVPPA